jgi:transposase
MFSAQEIFVLRKENTKLKTTNTKLKTSHLSQKQKIESLEGKTKKLEQENKRLKEELERIKKQRDTYKGMIFKAKVSLKDGKEVKKQLGGQLGHSGDFRKLPSKIDQKVRVFFKVCPNCHAKLKRSDKFETHTVEDIPSLETIKTVVTEYKSERQWCGNCHREVVSKPAMVLPFSRLGLNLVVQILIFKYICRMSLGVLVETLNQTYGVKISEAGVINILQRVKKWLGKEEYGKLLQSIRSSPVKHADETSWRIKGVNGWLWAFLTRSEVYYTIEETRGGGIAEAVLGVSKKGQKTDDVLIRDDYSGYKNLKLNHQSCWVHLLRKSKEEVKEKNCSKQMHQLHQTLKQMFSELAEIQTQPFKLKERQQHYQNYSGQLEQIIQTKFKAKDACRIQTRIKNQNTNLITALLHKNVPLTNNAAERQIRPAVIIRKISGGSRSDIGAETMAVNFSIIQSIRMRNQPVIPTLQTMILKGAGKN